MTAGGAAAAVAAAAAVENGVFIIMKLISERHDEM
jgi:hypothetical protein